MEAGKWLSTVSPSKCPATLLNSLEQFPAFSTAERIHQKKVDSKICKRIRHSWRTVRFSGLSPCEHTTASQLFQTTPASPSLRAPSLVPGSENGLGTTKKLLAFVSRVGPPATTTKVRLKTSPPRPTGQRTTTLRVHGLTVSSMPQRFGLSWPHRKFKIEAYRFRLKSSHQDKWTVVT